MGFSMRIIQFSSLLIILVIFSGCRPPAAPVSISNSPVSNDRMPRTNLPMPPSKPLERLGWTIFESDEKKVMEDYKGKVVVLDFWATYCPPCIEGIPHLRALNSKYGKDIAVIGLHVGGDEDRPNVPAFIKRLSIDYPVATPEDELTYTLLGDDNRIPQTLIFDRKGKLVKQFVSFDEVVGKQIDAAVEEAMKQ